MTELIILIALALVTGFFVKLADSIDDKTKIPLAIQIISGIIYGILIFIFIKRFETITTFWLAIVAGMILSLKIDRISHFCAIGILGALLIFFGVPAINILFFSIIVILSVTEEKVHDLISSKIRNKTILSINEIRPILEITFLAFSVITLNPMIFLSLFLFDIGYVTTEKLIIKKLRIN